MVQKGERDERKEGQQVEVERGKEGERRERGGKERGLVG